ncbi:MAG: Eco57I restriction-modification methylase domain-containing protein [Castellaniella sp.]|uniref:Eco57I restriction-modification methylase domain-containing protein n=1 Tax=Castellaniella sp. TaxID=1955812 RepID=UPI002A35A15F|nr:Eco57I restriction-modification methylase domain-containing protein [Castellaniella sp.]MDY0308309.1 Eco57I restriction-modification methylase domain-containing protein [Castellaniella sp.]
MIRKTETSDSVEKRRLTLQAELDGSKTQAERNRLGQFATPTRLAHDILAYGLHLLPKTEAVRFLDPAIGTGSFYSALRSTRGRYSVAWARGFEIDPHYGNPAQKFWRDTPLDISLSDFTQEKPPSHNADKSNLLICNPPYVRHHHIGSDDKRRLQNAAREAANIEASGLSGLYCYFLALSHRWMSEGGIAGWLIPSEFMDVNYGKALKAYLLREVTLLHIHRFDPNDVQFDDAQVSSAVVWFKKQNPPPGHQVTFSFGGTLQKPSLVKKVAINELKATSKWTRFPHQNTELTQEGYRLGDLFSIKRGLATGDNDFFILDEDRAIALDIPSQFLRPILPSTRYVRDNEIMADEHGIPLLEKRLFLLDCNLPEHEVQRKHPTLWAYLQTGRDRVAQRYLCRSRRHWYAQERRPAAPIVCTYIGRSDHGGKPFRFLLNHSKATATNVYLMLYPSPLLMSRLQNAPATLYALWHALNAIDSTVLLGNGRVYGGGMHKLEPRELANVPANDLAALVGLDEKRAARQLELEAMALL